MSLGLRVVLMYKPAYASNVNGSGQPSNAQMNTDLSNIQTSVQAFITAGLNFAGVSLWNEPQQGNNAVSVTDPQAQQYQALYAHMYPTFNGNGWPVWIVHTDKGWGSPSNLPAAYFPGPGPTTYNPGSLFCDVVCPDYYGGAFASNHFLYTNGAGGALSTTFPSWGDLADLNGLPLAIGEAGNAASSTDHTQAVITKYLSAVSQGGFAGDSANSVQAAWEYRGQNGLPTEGFAWWVDPSNFATYAGTTGTNATPCVFTSTGSNLSNNNQVTLSAITGLSGFNNSTLYYVASATANTFQLSAYPGGPGLGASSSGSCTPKVYGPNLIFNANDYRIPLLQQLAVGGPAAVCPIAPIVPPFSPAVARGSSW
jgi:hypothetical protein